MVSELVLVAGPPCAGKTTYVAEHADPDDLVLDADQIGEKTMRQRLRAAVRRRDRRVWVIRCAAGPDQRESLTASLGATRTVLLDPGDHVLHARAKARPQPQRHLAAIRAWRQIEDGKAPAKAGADPPVRGRTRW